MGKETAISWTETTWNPVTGCDKVSAGCDNCYALMLAPRLKAMGSKRYQKDGDPRTSGPGFGLTLHEDLVRQPLAWKAPRMIFVNSMSDLFYAKVPLSFVKEIFATMEATPNHTYQVLTKRASRLPKIVDKLDWPKNLWMGVSVENEAAMERIDLLKCVPTTVRFLSAEPLIGPLPSLENKLEGIHWVIVGGESGPNFRPLELPWARAIKEACVHTDTSFFFKQVGGLKSKSGGNKLDGEVIEEWPFNKKPKH
jgi:protein gp37